MVKNDLAYYDRHANTWWEEGQVLHLSDHFNRTRFEFISNYISNWRGLSILDVGCGGGLACEWLAKLGANVSGIDLSKNSIEAARSHADQEHLRIDYRQGKAEALPYETNRFDCVLCFDVLEHVSDFKQVIREIHRVLQPGGIFFFDTVNRTLKSRIVMIWLLEKILKQLPQGLHDWQKFIRPDELIQILTTNQFQEIEIKGFDVTDGANLETLRTILFQGFDKREKGNLFPIQINDDTSICYIGKSVKKERMVSINTQVYQRNSRG
ncbi:3-demethylubiquinone-9 3-O-methyltransferase [Oscillatoria sp. FACHB-1407]|uniref:bifunctional 2-polyprenyl-6-hydroxyphenol methylase/3-demethylubiquinol 3-O-methyltransferase UbiG n=1 Tax=Oscillatoria sp. FACHB-1407 TaxID=2692847 RepID=UPI0016889217|nr:bifunctional 2-polyprenyl-6-hydroxyphenol methylase/3-demethylubiquinol 3-O-methyltransferase UbiG [Oscillatoria sp. FACHB-1407]MBD2461896.1 3-demethylubiquinone-9 3-O-methyltransferase [Oscillatoria sp. FACHB-1407]